MSRDGSGTFESQRARPCAGLLLTGGASRRMGVDKATLSVGGEQLAVRAARLLTEVCDPVVEVGPGVSGLPSLREDPPGSGPLAALIAGADAVGVTPVLLLAVDLPFVTAPLLRRIAGWPGEETVVPVVSGRAQLVCARYGAQALRAARSRYETGERSLRWVVGLPESVEVDAEDVGADTAGRAFADLDSPEDLARWAIDAEGL